MSGTAKSADPAYQCKRRGRNDEKKCSRAIVAPTLEDFVSDAAVRLLSELRVDGRLASSNLSEGVSEEVEDSSTALRARAHRPPGRPRK
jgi:hypothetical protein